jgi:hypothetical protein
MRAFFSIFYKFFSMLLWPDPRTSFSKIVTPELLPEIFPSFLIVVMDDQIIQPLGFLF